MMRKLTSTIPDWMEQDLKELDDQYPALKEAARIARADANELIEALKTVGIWIQECLWEFINTRDRYTEAIPLLIKYLPKLKYEGNIEAVIRALTIKEAKGIACKAVIAAYHRGDKMRFNNHAICATNLRTTLTMDYIDDVVEIISEVDQLIKKKGVYPGYLIYFAEAICKWRLPAKRAIIQEKAGAALKNLWKKPMGDNYRKRLRKALDKLYK